MADCEFLHAVDKAKSEELLLADGGANDAGKFLIRYKGAQQNNNFILSVVYKGQATHHVLARDGDGAEFTLNKQPTGETTLNGVIQAHRSKRPKWPVPLTTGVSAQSGGPPVSSPPPATATSTLTSGGAVVHTGIGKGQAETLLGSGSDGTHLVRSKGDSKTEFILSVIYKGKPTHHQLIREGSEFTLNKTPTGESTLEGVLKVYRSKRPKWPVPLTDIVRPEGAASAPTPAANAPSQPTPATPTATAPAAASSSGVIVHTGIGKGQAEKLLGSGSDGTHLVRSKGDSSTEFILSVIYKGKPTHHQLVREGSEFTLNKTPTGESTLEGVLQVYRSKRPKWPVPLTDIVRPEGVAPAPASAVPEPVATPTPEPTSAPAVQPVVTQPPPAKAPEPTPEPVASSPPGRLFQPQQAPPPVVEPEEAKLVPFEMSEYFHGGISQPEAETAVKKHGETDGTFLFRDSTKIQHDYILTMFKGGRVIHHGLVKSNGTFKVDGIPCGPASTLLEVIEWGSTAHPGWNVPLREGVPGLTCASDEEIVEQQVRMDLKKAQASKPGKVNVVKAAVVDPGDMFAKMQERRRQQEKEQAEQEARDRAIREERVQAEAEARARAAAVAAAPSQKKSAAELEAARQKRLAELADLPVVSSFALSRAANVDLSDDSSDDEPPIEPLRTARASDDSAVSESLPKDVGYLEVSSTGYKAAATSFDENLYMHGDISKGDADALLVEALENDPLANGKFFIRKQGRDKLVLCLVHNGMPTHHLLTTDDTGCFSVSGHATGQTTIPSLLVLLSQSDLKWWPSPLSGVIPPQEKVQRRNLTKRHSARIKSIRASVASVHEDDPGMLAAATSKREKARKSVKRKTSKKPLGKTEKSELEIRALAICAQWENDALGYTEDGSGDGDTDSGRDSGVVDGLDAELGPFFHRGIDKDEAVARLGTTKGNFLLRYLNEGDLNNVIVTAVFKGQATHHLLTRTQPDASYKMNEVDLEVTTIEGILEHLGQRRPYWPLRLLNGIAPPETCKMSASAAQLSSQPSSLEKEQARRLYRRTLVRDLKATVGELMEESVVDTPDRSARGSLQELRQAMDQLQSAQTRYDSVQARQQAMRQQMDAKRASAAPAFQITQFKKKPSAAAEPQSSPPAAVPGLKIGAWKKPSGSAAAPPETATPKAASGAPEASQVESEPVAADPPSSSAETEVSYVHESLTKSAAEELLTANGGSSVSGKFLIRSKGDDYVLSVIYKGNPTHHAVSHSGTEFTVNKQSTGETSLAGVVEYLREKRPKWPVPLTDAVLPDGQAPASTATTSTPAKAAPTPSTSASKGASNDVYHTQLDKARAEAMLLEDGGANVSGKHLVRCKGGSTNDFVLSVIYKGTPTHHALVRESEGAEFTLNKQPTGETSLEGVLAAYREKKPKWPVPLTDIVRPISSGAAASQAPSAQSQASGNFKFLHKSASKADAEALLLADDGASKPGKFLIRTKGGSNTNFILSVVYKEKATHHALVRESEGAEFTLNNTPTGQNTLAGVCEAYREKRPKWPVPLTEGVAA